MSKYAKSIAALLGALATWGVTAVADNSVSSVELFGLLAVLGTWLATFQAPYTATPGANPERGAADLTLLVQVLVVVVLAVLAVLLLHELR